MARGNETDRFQRWQKISIDQLTYALNLLLTLAIAAFAYLFSLLRDEKFHPESTAKWALRVSFGALTVSAACSLLCVLNRLHDFRGTAQRAKGSEDAPSQDELRGVGDRTWALFYVIVIAFAIGIGLMAFALFWTYGGFSN